MTPQTITGLCADQSDLNGNEAPLATCAQKELDDPRQCKAVCRAPAVPTRAVDCIQELALGPPTHDQPKWAPMIGGPRIACPAPVLFEQEAEVTRTAILVDGPIND